jgi:DNA-directed RNA polymerase specialized sigma24 family protein
MSSKASGPSLLATATVRADVTVVLKQRGVHPDDLHDLVQETLARALAVHSPPRDLAECMLLTRVIARNVAVDHVRRRIVRQRHHSSAAPEDQPARDDPFADPRDPIDRRRQLTLMMCDPERGGLSPRELAIVHAVSERVPQAEIAAELGVCHQTVRNELWRARRFFQATWCALESSGE